MADGAHGPAVARAMDLLIRYGEALGAEKLVEVTNVAGTWSVANPILREYALRGMDAVFSEFNLDSPEVVETPPAAVPACQLIGGIDARRPEVLGVSPEVVALNAAGERYFAARGIAMHATCTPYQVGHVPLFGEHCAWMESSAVVYANAVIGARTNTEGRESTGAAAITRRIPYWGLHIPENRAATHLVQVEIPLAGMRDWGLFGYWLGAAMEEGIPALHGLRQRPRAAELKHFGAAAASSGGIEMYHIPTVTPEAPELAAAFRGRSPRGILRFGSAERRAAWEALNRRCTGEEVDFIMIGCPHAALEHVQEVARLLEGKRIRDGVALWVFTPRALGEMAERSGLADVIRAAGGHLLSDTCPAISRLLPRGVQRAATDSAKQAHYLPAITGVETWFGSLDACVRAALTGRFTEMPP